MNELLEKFVNLKARELMPMAIGINFCQRATQPIKNRVHPSYEYLGLVDPTREVDGAVSVDEIYHRLSGLFKSEFHNTGAPIPSL